MSASAAMDAGSGSTSEGSGEASGITITAVTSDSDGGESGSGTSTTSDTETTEGTTGIDGLPPEILDVSVWPAVITANGPITVEVDAVESQGVELLLENGTSLELSEDEPGHFVGDFPVLTAGENGSHTATVVAWRGDLSDEADVTYAVELPESGSELYWEASDSPFVGEGFVVAMSTLPSGHIVELITRTEGDARSCVLRRRSAQGDWNPNSVMELLPGEACEGIDLVIDDEGTIHTLLRQKVGLSNWRWLLSKTPTFGTTRTEVASGSIGEEATALALRRETGAVAVCGSTPSGLGDLDAFVRVYESGEWEQVGSFDHPLNGEEHSADEMPSDCIFVDDDRLVLVGEVLGDHQKIDESHSRRFVLPVLLGGDHDPSFAIGEGASQSFVTAVAAAGQGRIYAAGYACDVPCKDEILGRLWVYDVEGVEVSSHALGSFSYPEFAPQAMAWSPAEYLVIANGGFQGDEASFVVRAFEPESFAEPLWTFTRKDPFVTHIPLVALVGRYGELYFGGIGANVYPGVLFLGS